MLLTVALAASLACAVPPGEISKQVVLPYGEFDSYDGSHGWRSLNSAGCTDAAVALLQSYANSNRSTISADQSRELAFHTGQVLAIGGRETEAVANFEQANAPGGTDEWHTYVNATLAFLRRDMSALVIARNAYAAIAPGSMRLSVIDGFIKCFRDPYAKAIHCAMPM